MLYAAPFYSGTAQTQPQPQSSKKVLHLMPHQNGFDGTLDEKSLWFLCVPLCGRGIWYVIPGYPKTENGAPRGELKNGRGRGWAVPYLYTPTPRRVSSGVGGGGGL